MARRKFAIGPADTGLHVSIAFRQSWDDQAVTAAAWREGVEVRPLSRYYAPGGQAGSSGLLLGFAQVPVADIGRGVATLYRICKRH